MSRIGIEGDRFVDTYGRHVILRGVNLGGDCKVPASPDGRTHLPTDFSDHRSVSFIGRPFPLAEADAHFRRLGRWGFNCLRLLTTWEAVEHAGPGQYDDAYLDYLAAICRKAGEHGFSVFIDFHQDVWSRMTGGDGAPGWTLETVGLDPTKLSAADCAHVMQARYDFARGGRQEDRYPTMSWGRNYRMAANGIMWTLFWAGRLLTPGFLVDGVNIQNYLQNHFMGAMAAVARRLRGMPHVIGFDTLNEPGTGWIGQSLTFRNLSRAEDGRPAFPGPAWTALDGLAVASGIPREIPILGLTAEGLKVTGQFTANPAGVSAWLPGRGCPFAEAGAWEPRDSEPAVLVEDFFRRVGDRMISAEVDGMLPFFHKVAATVRAVEPHWLIFAEVDPFAAFLGHGFPPGMPERCVNASHWYCLTTLVTKRAQYPLLTELLTGKRHEGNDAIRAKYEHDLARIKGLAEGLRGGGPTLIGEFGIPFDLEGGASYAAWRSGARGESLWEKHAASLSLMYDAMDSLSLSSTQWNYTASNSNDLAIGDGWNQEDLSIYSADQTDGDDDPDAGGRAIDGFFRPWCRAAQGTIIQSKFDRAAGTYTLVVDADTATSAATEIFLPGGPEAWDVTVEGGQPAATAKPSVLEVWAQRTGTLRILASRKSIAT